MKKLIITLITIMMFIPTIVLADMGAPVTIGYEAEVTNPNGVIVSNGSKEIKLEYKQKIIVEYETDGYDSSNKHAGFKYDGDYYSIDIKEITPIKEEYEMNDSSFNKKVKAIALKDVEIKKGPADAYKSTGTIIKANTNFSLRMMSGDIGSPWAYVEYNGVKGYITVYPSLVVYNPIDIDIITIKKVNLDTSDGKVEIPANTNIKTTAYQTDPWGRSYYLTYNNKTGLLSEYGIAVKDETIEVKTIKSTKLYESTEENAKVVKTVGIGKTYKGVYNNGLLYRTIVYIPSEKGWIVEDLGAESTVDIDNNSTPDVSTTTTTTTKKVEQPTNPKDYTLYYVIGAVAICLTAVVILVLVNKDKKKEDK